jgi:hypothetical protein
MALQDAICGYIWDSLSIRFAWVMLTDADVLRLVEDLSALLFYDETGGTEDDRGFVDVVVLVTGIVRREIPREAPPPGISHLNVPTPPASRINVVSESGFPVQRMANARRIWP